MSLQNLSNGPTTKERPWFRDNGMDPYQTPHASSPKEAPSEHVLAAMTVLAHYVG